MLRYFHFGNTGEKDKDFSKQWFRKHRPGSFVLQIIATLFPLKFTRLSTEQSYATEQKVNQIES